MFRVMLAAAGLLLLTAALRSEDPKDNSKSEKPSAAAQKYVSLLKDFQEANREGKATYGKYARKFLDLAKEIADDPAAVDALIWVVDYGPDSKEAGTALEALKKDHLDSPKMVQVCRSLNESDSKQAVSFLRAVLDNSKDHHSQGQACYSLATHAKRIAQRAKDNDEENADNLTKEAEDLFERVIKDFGDIKYGNLTFKDFAEGEVFEMRFLVVGMNVPEIDGEDTEGARMKLSDFKGKVVLLEFWGHWCGACMSFVPHERELVKKLDGKPFAIVGINSDRDRDKSKEADKKSEITWRSFWNGGSPDGSIATKWNVRKWPTLYLIDHTGVIRNKYKGLPGDSIDRVIGELVKDAERAKK